jgi:hypothetical protein
MEELHREYSELVQLKAEYYTTREDAKRKADAESEASPYTAAVSPNSSSELELDY